MAHYLLQGSYSAASIKSFLESPQDRSKPARALIESAGGTFHHMFFGLGDSDYYILCELPDPTAAAAISMSVGATGTMTTFKTTALLTMTEAMAAMTKAKDTKYTPPSASTARA